MGVVYGIDFGTSTSAIVIGRGDGGPGVRVRDPGSPHGLYSVPSAVCVEQDGTLKVGATAERMKRMHPDRYRSGFKRDIADPSPARLGELSLRPFELAAEVVAFLRAQALAAVPEPAEHVVVTVPAAWEGTSRDFMLKALERAGFGSVRTTLITEPVAAAAYATSAVSGVAGGASAPADTILLYDLGGGTFDCAVVRRDPSGASHVLGTPGGLQDVGGLAFDHRILRHIRALHPDQATALLDGDTAADASLWRRRLQLRDTCEQIKIQLSIAESHQEYLTEFDPPAIVDFTRADLDALVGPLIDETIDECERMLAVQGLSWTDLDAIVPVGGSTRLPQVAAMLAARTGRPVRRIDDPDLAVAHGAALLAGAESPAETKAGTSGVRRPPVTADPPSSGSPVVETPPIVIGSPPPPSSPPQAPAQSPGQPHQPLFPAIPPGPPAIPPGLPAYAPPRKSKAGWVIAGCLVGAGAVTALVVAGKSSSGESGPPYPAPIYSSSSALVDSSSASYVPPAPTPPDPAQCLLGTWYVKSDTVTMTLQGESAQFITTSGSATLTFHSGRTADVTMTDLRWEASLSGGRNAVIESSGSASFRFTVSNGRLVESGTVNHGSTTVTVDGQTQFLNSLWSDSTDDLTCSSNSMTLTSQAETMLLARYSNG